MKILYYCHSGVHASVVASGIHLGLLPVDRKPSHQEILQLPHFDNRGNYPSGTPFFMGQDEGGNYVYTLAVGNEALLAPKTVRCFMDLFALPSQDTYLVDAVKYSTAKLKWGGWISVDLGLKMVGRPMILSAINRAYSNYVEQVQRLKQKLKLPVAPVGH